jgi:circadian clock protein KaiB
VPDEPLVLRLFVAGPSRRSQEAERMARRIVDEYGTDGSHLEVIDVFDDPEAAEAASVLATPTLVRVLPAPQARVIGGLDDHDLVVSLLDLPHLRTAED